MVDRTSAGPMAGLTVVAPIWRGRIVIGRETSQVESDAK